MPLDGHSYLVAQGWTGSGTGLRDGAISRPLAIPQKKNLAGLGKDRDEAFPFWDHLFSAASKAIQIKLSGADSDTNDSDLDDTPNADLKRTSTGILSNRRPIVGTSADTSGTSTPDVDSAHARLSLLAQAKRDAAKRGLYSRFFRGPVVAPDSDDPAQQPAAPVAEPSDARPSKKRRRKSTLSDADAKDDSDKRERKRLRQEKRERKELRRQKKERKELRRLKKEKKESRRRKEDEGAGITNAGRSTEDVNVAEKQERKRERSSSGAESSKQDAERVPRKRKREDIGAQQTVVPDKKEERRRRRT
ncbi:unnamed protein product [Mycena citricolor]|uniref:G-patch domain-containing protein n=1 Tax=Mycena citricolor TaxID=2018698 RepID=A0AAD2H743_9AGAR|nr:unnamed protein product [Mycena citricolor]